MKQAKKPILNICHLYSKSMNTYGDRGNIITLVKLCEWNEIKANVTEIEVGEKFDQKLYDMFFIGGGQDKNQERIAVDLLTKKTPLKKAVETNKVFLLVCGSYQLFGYYFKTYEGIMLKGLKILDIHTIGSTKRKIGNVIVQLNTAEEILPKTLVGFENHSGNTFLHKGTTPLGKVVKGYGNNDTDKIEGIRYKNCFGTYLHGSLLPKNPHFAKYLISLALKNKYGKDFSLDCNNDLELQAHQFILDSR
ncbi:glutamine amidotransferase [Candidatus Beckwithbacteria bacterium]|nr:glutamine amidotransferase [Candidatus Beckwithbacteria bacterium]